MYFRAKTGECLYARQSDGQVGLYDWNHANAHESQGRLISDYNSNALSLAADGVVLTCAAGESLEVSLVAA